MTVLYDVETASSEDVSLRNTRLQPNPVVTGRGLKFLRRNAVSNAIGIAVSALSWIVLSSVLLHQLGYEEYGAYLIATSFAGILGFLELGLTSSATKFTAEVDIRNNPEALERIVSNNIFIFLLIGSFLIAACSLFAAPIASRLFPEGGVPATQLVLAVKLVGMVLALTLLRNAVSSVLMGLHRYDIYNVIQVSYVVLLAGLQVAIVMSGGRLVALLIGNFALLVVCMCAFVIAIRIVIPGLRMIRLPDPPTLRLLFSFGIYLMILNLGAALLFNLDKILVGRILGGENVAYYAVPMQLALKIQNGLAIFVSFLFPIASELQSVGDYETMRSVYLRSTQCIALLDGLVLVFLAMFGPEILSLWMGKAFAVKASPLLALVCLGYLFFSLTVVPYHFLLGSGRPGALAVLNSAAVLFVIAAFFVGLKYFGLLGTGWGLMLGMCTMSIFPWYTQRQLGVTWRQVFTGGYGRIFLCSLLAAGSTPFLLQHFTVRIALYVVYLGSIFAFGNIKDLARVYRSAVPCRRG